MKWFHGWGIIKVLRTELDCSLIFSYLNIFNSPNLCLCSSLSPRGCWASCPHSKGVFWALQAHLFSHSRPHIFFLSRNQSVLCMGSKGKPAGSHISQRKNGAELVPFHNPKPETRLLELKEGLNDKFHGPPCCRVRGICLVRIRNLG